MAGFLLKNDDLGTDEMARKVSLRGIADCARESIVFRHCYIIFVRLKKENKHADLLFRAT